MITKEDLEFIRECDKKKVLLLESVEDMRSRFNCDSWERLLSKETFDIVKKSSDEMLEQYEQHVHDMIQENDARKRGILEAIDSLPPVEREVIRMRYQDERSWNWIARQMHYSDRMVFNIHSKALQHLGAEDVTH